VGSNPPSSLNSGDVWHTRKVSISTLADANGASSLTAGAMLLAMSGNASNLPVRLQSIKAWAVAGATGQYPPTYIQVNYQNEEFCQTLTGATTVRDGLTDAGGQGAGCPGVGLYIPDSLRLTRNDWGTGTSTVIATATSLPSGARVLWHVVLSFKL